MGSSKKTSVLGLGGDHGFVLTAGKSHLSFKSDLGDRLSTLLPASDQIGFVCQYITKLSAWVAVVVTKASVTV